MTTDNDTRHRKARKSLGHSEAVLIKLHPDLKAHIEQQAEANYCSTSEYVRRLIILDIQAQDSDG
jgi:hypothetical protein